jgi:aminoacrylate hydrolase
MSFAVAADGCRLFYEVTGRGPPLVLVPGFGGVATFFDGLRSRLSGFTLVLLDHRGAGRSDRPEGEYSIAGLADDLAVVLDAAGIESADLLGHSTGGTILQEFALARPKRVKRLVLSGTWARPDTRFRLLFETRLAVLAKMGPAVFQDLTHLFCFPPAWVEAHAAELAAASSSAAARMTPLSVVASRLRMILAFDRSADLARIAAPTLVIGAGDDALVPFGMQRALAAAIEGAELAEMTGGHFFPLVDPAGFAERVLGFLGVPS